MRKIGLFLLLFFSSLYLIFPEDSFYSEGIIRLYEILEQQEKELTLSKENYLNLEKLLIASNKTLLLKEKLSGELQQSLNKANDYAATLESSLNEKERKIMSLESSLKKAEDHSQELKVSLMKAEESLKTSFNESRKKIIKYSILSLIIGIVIGSISTGVILGNLRSAFPSFFSPFSCFRIQQETFQFQFDSNCFHY